MEEKKFELTDETREGYDCTLYRIKALKYFSDVKKGDIGGWIEKEDNLSQDGNCWVYNDAKVFDEAKVFGNARVYGHAEVHGDAMIYGNACVSDDAQVFGDANVYDNALVYDGTIVYGNAKVYENAEVYGKAIVCDNARICDDAEVYDHAGIADDAVIYGEAKVSENAQVRGYATINDSIVKGYAIVSGYSKILDKSVIYEHVRIEGWAVIKESSNICGDMIIYDNPIIKGTALISSIKDYIVFKDIFGEIKNITWTKSNDMWCAGTFYGTGEQLIESAENNECKKKYYSLLVSNVNEIKKIWKKINLN